MHNDHVVLDKPSLDESTLIRGYQFRRDWFIYLQEFGNYFIQEAQADGCKLNRFSG